MNESNDPLKFSLNIKAGLIQNLSIFNRIHTFDIENKLKSNDLSRKFFLVDSIFGISMIFINIIDKFSSKFEFLFCEKMMFHNRNN